MWIHDISENQFSVSTQILYPELQKTTMSTLQMFFESSFEPGDWTLHYRTPWACDGTNAGWYSVNSEVGAAGQSVQLLSPGLRYKVWGFFFPWMWAILEWDQPSLRPSRTGVVHPVVTESACERNYSSFAPLGVRRRDPAYRSDSWTGWMVALRDDPPSEDKGDRCITTAQPRSVYACLISGAVLKMYVEINIKLSGNSYYWADNRFSRCCMMMW